MVQMVQIDGRNQGAGNSHNPHPGTPKKMGYRTSIWLDFASPLREGLKYRRGSVPYEVSKRRHYKKIQTTTRIPSENLA